MRRRLLLSALIAMAAAPAWAQAPRGPLVLAAASLQEAFDAAASAWARKGHPRPILSYAASSALARQVQAGARADLFASADRAWMDVVAKAGRIVPGTRADIAGNRLVVVAARGTAERLTLRTLGRVLSRGPVAMADPAGVPAGRYGQAALTRLGAWAQVAPHVVRAENVRAALALVERGAAPYGIVYATDARASGRVRIAGVFPTGSHPPIRYPIARLTGGSAEAEGFRRFLLSREGVAILTRHGFTRPR
ncbi:molybdate ABC transporter substrate-binding protein [Sphingomonas sp.]|jgi:molybdate transport system substrate-binding protein|uniref:molybdate ABC transporter substrate-binding protein n=1 Tax=Sphingomonas sp. TaxID=28214 RepID=UPI002EDA1756